LPMMNKYGEQLEILGLDVTQEHGQTLFLTALQEFNLEKGGVPFLVVDDMYLMGSLEIPEKFPDLVETCLAQGGAAWPDIPGLQEAIAASLKSDSPTAVPPGQSATPASAAASPTPGAPMVVPGIPKPAAHQIHWTDNFTRDLAANTLAVLVLAGMLASVAWAMILFRKTNNISSKGDGSWTIPILCLLGFGVAGYLAYVETTQATAVCGPVGDCNAVQQSEYARLFGILPVGGLGLLGYSCIFIAWILARYAGGWKASLALLFLFVMTVFGTLFSIYLTFLEPFVIGATCAWCLTSAGLMTILMLLTVRPAKTAFSRLARPRLLRRERFRIGVRDD